MTPKSLDFMAIGAHPDDVEILAGGTLLKLRSQGRSGILVDATDGSAGTRGTPEIRLRESNAAAKLLGVQRECLGLQDSQVENNGASQKQLIECIRRHRPKVLITHLAQDEHPDHRQTAELVKDAAFKAGLAKIACAGMPYRPERIFYFLGNEFVEPRFCVDITDFWAQKIKLILSYKSQFHNPEAKKFKGKTDLATPAFLENLEARNRFYGSRIKRKYAEAFCSAEWAEINDMTTLGGTRFT